MQAQYLGIFSMIMAQAVYVTIDACVQLLSRHYPISQLIFMRNFLGLMPFLVYMLWQKQNYPWTVAKIKLHFSNGLASVFGCYMILYALVIGRLNDVITISFSVVFFVSILSYFMLKEQVSKERWFATLIGFVGVIIALQPTRTIAEPAALYALLSCPFNAYGMIKGKQLSQKESTSETLYFNLVLSAVLALFAAPFCAWIMPNWHDLGLFVVIGAGASLAYGLVIQAYLRAPASVVGPMIYTAMIWSVAWAYFAWHEIPSPALMVGSVIIVCSGIYLITHQPRAKNSNRAPIMQPPALS